MADTTQHLRGLLCELFGCAGKRASFGFAVDNHKLKPKKKTMLELTITTEQMVRVTIKPVTDTGKPAKLDGAPKWERTSGDSPLEVAEDGLSANLVSSDVPGDSTFLVTADADIGDGVEEIADTITLHVLGALATNLGMVADAPVPKPVVG